MKNLSNSEEEKLRTALKGKVNPFEVPSGYFEELPGKISAQLNSLPDFESTSVVNPFKVPTKNQKAHSWIDSLLRPRIAIPLAFATIVIITGLFLYKQRVNSLPIQEEFTVEDLNNSYFLETIDEGLIAEALDNQKIDTLYDNYEQYLIDNNIDISQIENAL